jgi:hypothetical protein
MLIGKMTIMSDQTSDAVKISIDISGKRKAYFIFTMPEVQVEVDEESCNAGRVCNRFRFVSRLLVVRD